MNKRKIHLSQNEIVNLIQEHFKQFAGQIRRGTYNRQDPTGYENFTATIGMYGLTETLDKETNQIIPVMENVTVDVRDVTWGVEFEIKSSAGTKKGYWSRPISSKDGGWCRCDRNFLTILKQIWFQGQEEDFWVRAEMDCDGGYMTDPYANE